MPFEQPHGPRSRAIPGQANFEEVDLPAPFGRSGREYALLQVTEAASTALKLPKASRDLCRAVKEHGLLPLDSGRPASLAAALAEAVIKVRNAAGRESARSAG